MKLPIYMDNHATTPVDPAVLEAMLPYLTEHFGNAASASHAFGWKAEEAVESARKQVARLIGAAEREIVFTSGATESNNLALKGAARFYRERGNHLVTCATEHKAVLDTMKTLEGEGFRVTVLPVQADGRVDLGRLADALTPDTLLVSIMAANNEIGVLQPVDDIGRLCRERDILFHTDAVQATGKLPVNVDRMNADLLSLTAHKVYGPKGVGALYVRQRDRKVRLAPLIDGGGHEKGLRSGTLNVPGIVGLGAAFEVAGRTMPEESCRIQGLRESLRTRLFEALDDLVLNGSLEHRLPGNLNVSVPHVEGESLAAALRDVAVSSSSACSSASMEPSHVLTALGLSKPLAFRAIRFGIGRFNTVEEVDYVADLFIRKVRELRASRVATN
jgi:cysteine desulfurase